ncbi:N-acetyltransferase family protein [Phenylobacterium sp.]|jgi:phosphinothricin acetyltransferase|uniref:GNAT family N-acetyltransferase n=1 Tax=Phenylobacterium sp. TaxID=1871053 RepID=UPI002E35E7C4|nr:N-acetyltransferase family protein [Phenylobacterium sp.]HEX2559980.1 GNAT family N-acetyltransferase [Phenylobacterium sp.]
MIVRAAQEGDAAALAAIYGHHVLTGFGTFEEVPPSHEEMEQRRRAVVERGLPYLVAEEAGQVLGFAYAGPFRPRAAYRYTVEDSVYVAPDAIGRGVGKTVLSAVIAACEAAGMRQVVAVIGDSQNAGSIGLHRSLGFQDAGVGRSFGYKLGRWVDIVWMQKALNGGDSRAPDARGLDLSGH